MAHHSLDAIHPFWSPNGKRIVFCSQLEVDSVMATRRDSTTAAPWVYEIFVMAADGSDLRRITHDEGMNTHASFSPDGRRILFRKVVGKTSGELFAMDSDGTHLLNLTNSSFSDGWPAWSNDGSRIAFGSNREGDAQIYIMNADGTDVHQAVELKGRCTSPKWSPDGTRISFDRSSEMGVNIYVLDVN